MRTTNRLKRLVTTALAILVFGHAAGLYSQSPAPLSASAETLTLPQAVEIALRSNPSMQVTAAIREIADAKLEEARAGRLPSLQATEVFTTSNNPVFVFGALLEQGRFGPQNFAIDSLNHPDPITNFRSAVTLRLPVFDQRQTKTRVATARIEQKQADEQTELTAQQLRYTVIQTYYGVLVAQAHLEVSDEAVKTAEADVKRARDLFDTGVTVQSDLLAADVQLAEFQQQKIRAAGELVTAFAALNTALGLPLETPQRPVGELSDRPFAITDVAELVNQALQNRRDYQRAILSSQSATVGLRGARGEWLPRVDAVATAGASSRYVVGGSGDYAVGASVTFNLFDAGRKARIDQAHAALSLANAHQEQLANQIRFEVAQAHQQYISARERMAVVARVSAQATETLRIVQDRYEAGVTTITELLRAETALVRARTSVIAARYDQYVSYAKVLLVTGRLNEVTAFGS